MQTFLALNLPSGSEWFLILIIFVLLFGAKKLPELARGIGKSLGEFKKAKEEFDTELQNSMKQPAPPAATPTPAPGSIAVAKPTPASIEEHKTS